MDIERPILILEEGMDEPYRWLVEKELVTLGRWPNNDVVLPDRLVSRHHARIRKVGTQFILEDCGSTNGTFLNGNRLEESRALQDGDAIQVASRFILRFLDSASTAPLPGSARTFRLEINEQERRVTIGKEEVEVSAAQFALLALLSAHEGKVVSREDVIRGVWSEDEAIGITNQAMDALIRRLRERIALIDPDHQYIQTVRGHGFKFENRS